MPLAAVGIACLGLTPTFGGPDRPLHWAMTACMVGFGALLFTRHRLTSREGALEAVPAHSPRQASRALLTITALSATIVSGIVASHLHAGKPVAALSVLMPLAGLSWLGWLGLKIRQHRPSPEDSTAPTDRPSRRPPKRDSLTPPLPNQGDAASNRHASA